MTTAYRPWSYSRLDTARSCLRRFWLQYVRKLKGYQTPEIVHGQRLHDLFAKSVETGRPSPAFTPEELEAWNRVEIHARCGKPEVFLVVDVEGKPSTEKKDHFLLGHLDVVLAGMGYNVIDWKMGQGLQYDQDQAEIYAILYAAWHKPRHPVAVGFLFPFVEGVTGMTIQYTPAQTVDLFTQLWRPRILKLEAELGALDPENQEAWTPNPAVCGGCLQAFNCTYFTRSLIWPGNQNLAA